MTFDSSEQTLQSKPIECFAFAQGDEAWFYTTFNKDVVRIGDAYRAALIQRAPGFNQSQESEQSQLKVLLGYDLVLSDRIRSQGLRSTRGPMMMRWILTHDGDTEIFIPFIGECTLFTLQSTHVEVTVESVISGLKTKMLHVSGSSNCNHDFCGPGCGINMLTIQHSDTIASVSGRTVVVGTAYADGLLDAGWMEIGRDKWFIEHNVGNTLTLMTKAPASVVGSSCFVYDGCDHSYTTCRDKYNNTKRHGGFPLFPTDNMFTQRWAKERRTA